MFETKSPGGVTWRVAVALAVFAGVFLAWHLAQLLLLVFGSLVLSFPLRRLSEYAMRWTGLPRRPAVALVSVLLFGLAVLAGWAFGSRIAGQYGEFVEALAGAFRQLESAIGDSGFGRSLLRELGDFDLSALFTGGFLAQVTGLASTLLTVVATMLLIVFTAIYFAAHPGLYRAGVEWLAPPRLRPRWAALLDETGEALWGWLRGQLIAMAVVGVLTALMLWALGMPMAVPLGVLAFLLDFVPYIGPIAAAVPGLLIAFSQGGEMLLWVLGGYVLIQQIENNLVMPIVYRYEIALPPVLTVVVAVALGILFGIVGVLFAAPLLVVVYTGTRRLLTWRDEDADRTAPQGSARDART